MSDALAACWAALRAQGRAALIPYVTAGFPDRGATLAYLRGAADAGADIVELGIPWSDPVADGPVIQASTHAALAGGMTLAGALDLLAEARPEIPVVVFSYLNPVLAFGPARFADAARAAGAAGILITDLPAGADPRVEGELRGTGLPLVRLVAPTTIGERLNMVVKASAGFVYLIARMGVTGNKTGEPGALGELGTRVNQVRALSTLPVAIGFGVSDARRAAAVARVADGVVVGTALVERMQAGGAAAGLSFTRELRAALDGVTVPA